MHVWALLLANDGRADLTLGFSFEFELTGDALTSFTSRLFREEVSRFPEITRNVAFIASNTIDSLKLIVDELWDSFLIIFTFFLSKQKFIVLLVIQNINLLWDLLLILSNIIATDLTQIMLKQILHTCFRNYPSMLFENFCLFTPSYRLSPSWQIIFLWSKVKRCLRLTTYCGIVNFIGTLLFSIEFLL